MSAIDHRHGGAHPIDAERTRELEGLLSDEKFAAAVSAYTKEDDTHDVPYGGGSNTAGNTIFFDRRMAARIQAGQIDIDGEPFDPRPFLHVHEAIEGAAIRLLGWDYTKAHDLATVAERHAVEHAGIKWESYQDALRRSLHDDERETVTNPPPDLLLTPYEGTPILKKLIQPEATMEKPRMQPGAVATKPGRHSLAIASAQHLHAMGHMTAPHRDRVVASSRAALAKHKKSKPPKMMPPPKMMAPPPAFGALGGMPMRPDTDRDGM